MPKINVTLPHLFKPRWYQTEVYKAIETHNRIVLIAHRRAGKDLVCWNIMIQKAIERKGVFWYICATRTQAEKIIWAGMTNEGARFLDFIPRELIHKIDQTSKVIYLVNGSTIWLLGADADSLVGSNPVGIVMTEYALYQNDPYPLLRPILDANDGWVIFNSTPRGTNHFYTLYTMAMNHPKWKVLLHTVDYTKALSEAQLESIRLETPSDLFDQEYLCKFTDSAASVFKNVESIVDPNPNPNYPVVPYEQYRLGLDIAKSKDYTVITAINTHTYPFRVYPQVSFNQIDYPLQQARIQAEWYKYNRSPILMDETGGGKVFIDSLSQTINNVEGFTFTERSREELLLNLAIHIEQKKIRIPNDPQLIAELKGFQWSITPTGKQRATSTLQFDDRVMSLALACYNLPSKPRQYRNAEILQDVKLFDANRYRQRTSASLRYRAD
jgi:hypothetical protein